MHPRCDAKRAWSLTFHVDMPKASSVSTSESKLSSKSSMLCCALPSVHSTWFHSARAASLSDSLMAASTSSSLAPSRKAAIAMGTLMVDQAGSLPSAPARKSCLPSTIARETVAPNSFSTSSTRCAIAASRFSSSSTARSSEITVSSAVDEVVAVGAPGPLKVEQLVSTAIDAAAASAIARRGRGWKEITSSNTSPGNYLG